MRRSCALLLVVTLAGGARRAGAEDGPAPSAAPADVAGLVQGLSAPEVTLRRRAAFDLALLGAGAAPAAEALACVLQDEDVYVRETAGRVLAKLARDTMGAALWPALPALLEGLAHARVLVRKEAVSLLFQAGTPPPPLDAPLVEPLRKALRDEDAFVRANAAAILGQLIPAAQAARPDLAAALGDEVEDVRIWAAMALASLGAAPFAEALAARLEDKSAKVRAAAVLALGALGPEGLRWVEALAALRSDADKDVRVAVFGALAALGAPKVLPWLLAGLDDPEPAVRAAAAWAIATFGPEARSLVPALLARPLDVDAKTREALMYALGALGDPAALPGLRAGLRDADPGVRQWAVNALRSIGPESLDALADLLEALFDVDPSVRTSAATAISSHGARARKALPALRRALRDPDATALGNICAALGAVAVGDMVTARAAAPDLLRVLSTESVRTRGNAAHALSRIAPAGGLDVQMLIRAWEATPEPLERGSLCDLFAALGPAAKEAAPLLRTALREFASDPRLLFELQRQLFALARVTEHAEEALAVMARLTKDVEAGGAGAQTAALWLGRLDGVSAPARAALSGRVVGTSKPDVWAALALLRIGGEGSEAAFKQVRQALSGAKPESVLSQMDEFDEAATALIDLAPDVLVVLLEARTDGARSRAAHALAAWIRRFGAERVRGALPLLDASLPRLEELLHDPEPQLRLAVADLFDALALG